MPIVSNLRILKIDNYFGGTTFTLGWDDPPFKNVNVAQYNIFVSGINGSAQPQGPFGATKSPAIVRISTVSVSQLVFTVQTQLSNGLTSALATSPSVASESIAPILPGSSLGPSGVTAGTYGSGTHVGQFTVDAAGIVTSAANVAISVSGVPDGDKGDVTVTGGGTVWTIDNDVVTYAKMQNVSAADRLLGRGNGGGAGDVQEITLGTNLSLAGTVLNATGGGATWTEVEINFGTKPEWSKTFTIVDPSALPASKILVMPSGNVATGRVGNDLEWDNMVLGALSGTGQFTLTALATPGPVVGNRKVFYSIS